jgi:phage terminase large subunit-like protein
VTTDAGNLRVPRGQKLCIGGPGKGSKPARRRASRGARRSLAVADAYAREALAGNVSSRVREMARRYLAEREPGSGVTWDGARLDDLLAWGEANLATPRGPMHWRPWAVWTMAMLVARLGPSGLPLTRELVLQVPRGCGKTQMAAALAGWTLARACRDGRVGVEVIVLATMLEKATEVAKRLTNAPQVRSKEWRAVGLSSNRASMVTAPAGFIKCCASTPQNADGVTPTLVILDEAARIDETYNRAISSLVKVPGSQALVVTTPDVEQYSNPYGATVRRVEEALDAGAALPEGVLAVLHQADEGDDPRVEATWRKANPDLSDPVKVEHYRSKAWWLDAPDQRLREEFYTQFLATFTSDLAAAIPVAFFDACVEPWDLEEVRGLPAVLAVDFSVGSWSGDQCDLTSINLSAWDGRRLLSRNWHYWAGTDPASDEARTRQPLRAWMTEGRLVNCGATVDYQVLERQIEVAAAVVDLKWLVADPAGKAAAWCDAMEKKHGWLWSRAPQNPLYMGSAWAIWQDLVRGKRVRFDTDPVLRSCIESAICPPAYRALPHPVKSRSRSNIDGLTAAIMAVKVLNDREMLTDSLYADPSRISF